MIAPAVKAKPCLREHDFSQQFPGQAGEFPDRLWNLRPLGWYLSWTPCIFFWGASASIPADGVNHIFAVLTPFDRPFEEMVSIWGRMQKCLESAIWISPCWCTSLGRIYEGLLRCPWSIRLPVSLRSFQLADFGSEVYSKILILINRLRNQAIQRWFPTPLATLRLHPLAHSLQCESWSSSPHDGLPRWQF